MNQEEEEQQEEEEEEPAPHESAFGIGAGIGVSLGVVLGYVIIPTIIEMFEQRSRFKHSNLKVDDDDDDESAEGEQALPLLAYFDKFADVVKDDGRRYMTAQAFLRALLAADSDATLPNKTALQARFDSNPLLKLLFTFTDGNLDNIISFKEFSFIVTLLNCNEQQFRIAFKMLDSDGNGSIDEKEFLSFLQSMHKRTRVERHPITAYFFSNGKTQISFNEFYSFITMCKEALLKEEFALYSKNGKHMSADTFVELVSKSLRFANSQVNKEEMKRNLDRIKSLGLLHKGDQVDYDTFYAFHTLSKHLDDIALAVKLYASQGNVLDKNAFKRALERIANCVNDRTVDIVFALFDTNNDGTLQLEEFVDALKQRKIGNQFFSFKL